MDLIVEEIELRKKDGKESGLLLSNMRKILVYTKWKRGLLTEDDLQAKFFKNFEKDKRKKNILKRSMRTFIASLAVPLYDGLTKIDYYDTMNAIIRKSYLKIHRKLVKERETRIMTKKSIGETLTEAEEL